MLTVVKVGVIDAVVIILVKIVVVKEVVMVGIGSYTETVFLNFVSGINIFFLTLLCLYYFYFFIIIIIIIWFDLQLPALVGRGLPLE